MNNGSGGDANQTYDLEASGDVYVVYNGGGHDSQTYPDYSAYNDNYYATGSNATVFGNAWSSTAKLMNNDYNGTWTWTSEPFDMAANEEIGFKVVKNGSVWIPSGEGNETKCTATEAGTYVLTITYILNANECTGILTKVVKHTAANFPDENFLSYLSTTFPTQTEDGYWTPAELAQVETMDCSGKGIYSLKGIENFTALTTLNCSGNHLSSIDLSQNAVTDLTAGGQTVDFNSSKIKVNDHGVCFIYIDDFKNGLPTTVAQSEFDMGRVTWGAGCRAGTLDNDAILTIDGDKDEGGSFKYNYATTAPVTPIPIKANDGSSMEVTVNWSSAGGGTVTAINTIAAGKGEVKAVRYYNLMGVESATPFDGVNIVVKEFSDGTRETSKVVK